MTNSKIANKYLEDALKQIHEAMTLCETVLAISPHPTTTDYMKAITVVDSTIARVSGIGGTYRKHADSINNQLFAMTSNALYHKLKNLMGVLSAMAHDFENGNVIPFEELVRAEVFTDFLDMADHLLTQGYKDPAAVLIGGVLEDHIKKLCTKFSVPLAVPKTSGKGEREVTTSDLNIELRKAGAYSLAEQKSIDAQLAIRNDAAHADWNKYTVEQVRLMHTTVSQFIAAHR